jgi:hypothetical protein
MILVRWDNEWLLAQCAFPGTGRVGLIGGSRSRLSQKGFCERVVQAGSLPTVRSWRTSVPFDVDGITFYPELRYRGFIVHPTAWHPDSAEPILKVLAGRWLIMPSDAQREAINESLRRQGWEFDHHHGSGGYVHVEDPDLEKIEGPPPEGPF